MVDVIGGIMAVVHGIATADLPEDIAAQAKMPDDVRRELERLVLDIEDQASRLSEGPA